MKKPKYMPRKSSGYTEPIPYLILTPEGKLICNVAKKVIRIERMRVKQAFKYSIYFENIETIEWNCTGYLGKRL